MVPHACFLAARTRENKNKNVTTRTRTCSYSSSKNISQIVEREKSNPTICLEAHFKGFLGNNQKRVYPVRLESKTGTPWNQVKNTPQDPRHWPKTTVLEG